MLENKKNEFKIAMDSYNNNYFYNKFGIIIASIIIGMQLISVCNLLQNINENINVVGAIGVSVVLIFAYILADFISGIVHMYMDNNTNYKSIIGPFIAAFHLHHKQPKYKNRNPLVVYFIESGSKFWLAGYLVILVYLQYKIELFYYLNLLLVAIGGFSSFAEVSHYWCHNADKNNRIINKLQRAKILLPRSHHKNHHIKDNTHYAFLNGITDSFVNIIAKCFYSGYKNNSDLHVLAYKAQ